MLIEMGCCGTNMGQLTLLKGPGLGRVYVDIGVFDGGDLVNAIAHSWVALGFEPNPAQREAAKKLAADAGVRLVEVPVDAAGVPAWESVEPPLAEVVARARDASFVPSASTPRVGYLLPLAVSDAPGKLTFFIDGPLSSLDLAAVVVYSKNASKITSVRVPVTRLDDALPLETLGGTVHMLKADTQGFEAHVLRGAERTLAHTELLGLEFWPRGLAIAARGASKESGTSAADEWTSAVADSTSAGTALLEWLADRGLQCFDSMQPFVGRHAVPADGSTRASFRSFTRSIAEHGAGDRVFQELLCQPLRWE
jgi:FkbM family methyltransferase